MPNFADGGITLGTAVFAHQQKHSGREKQDEGLY